MSDSMFHQFPPYLSELSKDNGKGIGDDRPQQGEDTYRSGCEGQTLHDDHEFREGSPDRQTKPRAYGTYGPKDALEK